MSFTAEDRAKVGKYAAKNGAAMAWKHSMQHCSLLQKEVPDRDGEVSESGRFIYGNATGHCKRG